MRLKTSNQAPDLSAATVAVLLKGWCAEPPEGIPRQHGFGGGFLELYNIGGIAALWHEHEGWLRAQAAEWGWEPTFTLGEVPMFYGEYVANGGPEA